MVFVYGNNDEIIRAQKLRLLVVEEYFFRLFVVLTSVIVDLFTFVGERVVCLTVTEGELVSDTLSFPGVG